MANDRFTYILLIPLMFAAMLCTATLTAQVNPPVVIRQKKQDLTRNKELLARSYYNKGQYDKAVVLFEELYNKNPRQYYYAYLLNSLISLKEYKKADKLVKKQLKMSPSNYRYLVDQVYVYEVMGNTRKSDKMMKQILNNLPENKSLILQIATSFESKGYFNQALEVYRRAQMMPGNDLNFNLEKARVYQYTGDYENMFDSYLLHLDLHPEDMQMVKNRMQSLMRQDVDDNLSQVLKKKLLEKAQAEPGNLVYAEMLLWHALQTKDYEMAYRQARAIDMRFKGREEDMLALGDICLSGRKYETAAKAYGYVKDKKDGTPYYAESYTGYYVSIVRLTESDPTAGLKEYKSLVREGEKALETLGISGETAGIVRNLAHIMAFRLNEFDKAPLLLEDALKTGSITPRQKADLKLELADILLFKNKVWDATLLYSQVENEMKNEPIGHEAKFRNAKLFYYVGEYNWSLAKLDILKSATSKLIANDAMELSLFIKDITDEDTTGAVIREFGKADLLIYRGKYDSAMMLLDDIGSRYSGYYTLQHLVYKKAGLMETARQYEKADSLYAYLADSYPESIKADNALFRRAELLRLYLSDTEKAMELYMKLMRGYPDSIYAGEARKIYRMLRKEDNGGGL